MKLHKLSQYKRTAGGGLALEGVISPFLAAQELVGHLFNGQLEMTQLYRVRFDDPEMCTTWQHADIEPVHPDILAVELNFRYIALFADLGARYLPILLDFRDGDPKISELYEAFEWIKKASPEELKKVCDEVAARFGESRDEYRILCEQRDEKEQSHK
jgi:hypothetical protein